MKLSDATKVIIGASEAKKVYLGASEVWAPAAVFVAGTAIVSKDTYITSPLGAQGAETYMKLSLFEAPYATILLSFDLSGFGLVSSAILYIRMTSGDAAAKNRQVTTYRLLRGDWVEAQATWTVYKTGSNWTTVGANGSGSDYTPTNAVAKNTPASTPNWYFINVTNLWNDAINNGQSSLNLKMVANGFGGYNEGWFVSKENGSLAPYIDYIPA